VIETCDFSDKFLFFELKHLRLVFFQGHRRETDAGFFRNLSILEPIGNFETENIFFEAVYLNRVDIILFIDV
jgi:hypothetical protein